MIRSALSLLTLALLLPQDGGKKLNLSKVDGKAVRGELLELRKAEGKVRLKVSIMGGTMTVTDRMDEFTPASQFRILEAAAAPEDFAGHFALAKEAAELGLLGQAGTQCREALDRAKDAPDLAEKEQEVRGWAAGALEAMVDDAIAAGDIDQAEHCLKLLTTRLADQRSEEQLDAVAAKVETRQARKRTERAAERAIQRAEQEQREIERRLQPIEKEVDKADKIYRDAVRKSRSTSTSTRLCERAVDSYKKSWDALQKLVNQHPQDEVLQETAEDLAARMESGAIRAALHAANMLTFQSNYKEAMEWTQRVLAFDPDNREAKDMLRTIQISSAAASSNWGWGWAPPPRQVRAQSRRR